MNDVKFKIVENINDEDLMSIFNDDTVVYVKPGVFAMSDRKLESSKILSVQSSKIY